MKYILLLVMVIVCGSFNFPKNNVSELIAPPIFATVKRSPMRNTLELKKFMTDIAYRESNNKYWIRSKRGYLGKYQFHRNTLLELNIHVSDSEFLNNVSLQDSAMMLLIRKNSIYLRDIIQKYAGTYFRGVYITKSGILAGAHLVGPGGVRSFFDSTYHYRTFDSNGTTVQDYIALFANYKF